MVNNSLLNGYVRHWVPVMQARFEDDPPQSTVLTSYDREHLVTYLRLLDADAEGADWQEVVTVIFGLDPKSERERAQKVHASHLARARWMTEHGYRELLQASHH